MCTIKILFNDSFVAVNIYLQPSWNRKCIDCVVVIVLPIYDSVNLLSIHYWFIMF